MTAQLSVAKEWLVKHQLEAFLIKTVFGSVLIALFAQISIPMVPVPITGQTLAVTIVGFALGRNAGVSAVLLYLFEGAIGLPVFAGGAGGIAHFGGASGGYLYGFVVSAWILGHFSDKGVLHHFWQSFAVAIIASAATFVFGLIHLSFFVPEGSLLQYGLLPFIPGGIIKALLASVAVVPAYRFFSKL